MASKKCTICEKASGMYPLCNECFRLRDNGEIDKCDECGKWYLVEKGCDCEEDATYESTGENESCQICYDESVNGLLCEDCLEEALKGNIILCDKCGKYFRSSTRCECTFSDNEKSTHKKICPKCERTYPGAFSCHRGCWSDTVNIDEYECTSNVKDNDQYSSNNDKNDIVFQEEIKINETRGTSKDEKKCSKCNRPSGDFDICYVCYRKKIEDDMKRDIETLIESEKDSGVDIRKKWPAKIRTQNGQYVRSHAECRIADWLAKNEITYEYERMVVSKKDKNRYLLCDFYLPRADVYIEYWGYKDKETYTKRRNEKVEIYNEKGFIMLDIENDHLETLDDSLRQLLCEYYDNL